MTLDTIKTPLVGFPIQHDSKFTEHISLGYSNRGETLNNYILKEIGKAVSLDSVNCMHGQTGDGYAWFGSLEFKIGRAKVMVMFPWTQDWDHPISSMDRSVAVYSDKKVPKKDLMDLTERIAYQIRLRVPPSTCPLDRVRSLNARDIK